LEEFFAHEQIKKFREIVNVVKYYFLLVRKLRTRKL